MKVFILLSFVAVALATPECGENSHYESCGTACPITCKNYQNPPKFCVLMCNPGCHCDEGYVKTDDGRCVAPEECPAQTDEVCGENQVFNGCGTACPLTCDNYQNPPKICTMQCVIGCECAKGFVKTHDGRCVRPEECPASGSKPLAPVKCGENEVYKTCGTACPLTCNNYQNPNKFCTLQCVSGCACKNGFVKTLIDGRCVKPEECPASAPEQKTCLGEADPGMCKAYFPMWYYDGKSGQCKRFVYGGCGGNGNRYNTEEECMNNCGDVLNEFPVNGCELPPVTGPCRAYIPRYYFNKSTGKCEKFVYGGCKGNLNNFKSSEECEQTCALNAENACELPRETGPCRANFPRFFFNKSTGKCEKFVYGGCLGNSNNFLTSEECEQICGQAA